MQVLLHLQAASAAPCGIQIQVDVVISLVSRVVFVFQQIEVKVFALDVGRLGLIHLLLLVNGHMAARGQS